MRLRFLLVPCLALATVPVLRAERTGAPTLSRAEIEADLQAHGLAMKLPTDGRGAIEWIFDARLLRLHTAGLQVWVAPSQPPGTSPCTIDGLEAKAKAEQGFVAVIRREPAAPISRIAYAVRTAGRESFLVEGCGMPSRARCGAADLPDRAAVELVWNLCATLRDVPAQPLPIEARLGIYSALVLDADPGDRAEGRGGSGKRVRATLELRKQGETIVATYAVGLVGAAPPTATATLSDVRLTADTFHAAPIAIKAAWPYYLPRHFEGRFAEPGVLLLDGKRYQRAKRP